MIILLLLINLFYSDQKKDNSDFFPPQKVILVFTENSWGHIINQRIIKNETISTLNQDYPSIRLLEVENPADVFNKYEIYAIYRASEIIGIRGYLIVNLSLEEKHDSIKDYFDLNYLSLTKKGNEYKLNLGYRSSCSIRTWFYYSIEPKLIPNFDCTNKKSRNEVLNVTPFNNEFIEDIQLNTIDEKWRTTSLNLDPNFINQAKKIALCEEYFRFLNSKLNFDKNKNIWSKRQISTLRIRQLSDIFKQSERLKAYSINTKIEFDNTKIIDGDDIVATITKNICIQSKEGNLTEAKVYISINK